MYVPGDNFLYKYNTNYNDVKKYMFVVQHDSFKKE